MNRRQIITYPVSSNNKPNTHVSLILLHEKFHETKAIITNYLYNRNCFSALQNDNTILFHNFIECYENYIYLIVMLTICLHRDIYNMFTRARARVCVWLCV